jgi:potassium uptake TrkH family protein
MIDRFIRRFLRLFSRYQRTHKGPTLYELRAKVDSVFEFFRKFAETLIPILGFICFAVLVYDAGFNPFYKNDILLYQLWYWLLVILEFFLISYFLLELKEPRRLRSRIFNLVIIVLTHLIHYLLRRILKLDAHSEEAEFLITKVAIYASTFLLFLTEISQVLRFIYRQGFNPAFLFVASFFFIIVVGTLLLLLPNATTKGIKPVDAWFTSASAVCVTGLTVVDTATEFTHIGKLIILSLIQIGGLGIMTFAGLLSYLAAGSVSFRNQLALKDMLSSNKISTVISLVGRVIIVTFFFESVGAFIVYNTLDETHFSSVLEKIFFSIFHAVSAFCNAGFSTYTNGLYEYPVRFNYSLHLIIALLIFLGGIGFPIVFNIFNYIRIKTLRPIYKLLKQPFHERYVHILDATGKLAIVTTVILILFGFVTYALFEWNATLTQHPSLYGKFVTSLFGSITPRTAGFNTVDLTRIALPTVMVYLLLMWIGASPASTGGGIKTTTIAVAFLNMKSIVMGKENAEVAKTQIGDRSIQRAFAIIVLSLLVLGVTVLLLAVNEPDQPLFAIAFEAFSAFGTVGLTLGVTPDLSVSSKILLSFVMLTGRVGVLTMLLAFVTPAKQIYYRYPREEISL